jgi:hypothetical protein
VVDPDAVAGALATIIILTAQHMRTRKTVNDRHDDCAEELAAVREKMAELQDILARWTGLP